MRNDNLKNLRAEVRKRRNAVTAKEARIRRNTGVDIKNTAQDPRRPINVVERYNQRQLSSYLGELNAFMSRSIGYVAGADNAPIPKADWLAYKKLEGAYNKIGAEHVAAIGDVFIPLSGLTVSEREKLMVPNNKRAQGDIIHRPYGQLDKNAANIKSAEALAKLRKQLEKKISNDFLPAELAKGRDQLNKMLVSLGNPEFVESAKKLNNHQFNILWNYTGFAGSVSAIIPSGGSRSKAVKELEGYMPPSKVVDDFSNDIREFFDWASSIKGGGEKSTKRTKKR